MAVTFHSLLPLSESKDEIAERHSDSGILFPLTPTEDRLLQFDADLAERFSLLHDELEAVNSVGADVFDRLMSAVVDNLEQHTSAVSQAPTGSAVSKTARLRTERILRALLEVLHEVHTRLREDIDLNATEVRSLFSARIENSLGVTDPLVMELASVQILETTEENVLVDDDEADTEASTDAASKSASDSGIQHGAGQLLLGVSRAGRDPIVNKPRATTSISNDAATINKTTESTHG